MKRRSLCGSSQDRCRCAARPGGEAQEAEHDVLDPGAHVGLAAGLHLVRVLAGQAQDHRDVVRAEAPQRVLVGAQLAQVQPVRVDVVDVAQLAGVGDLLELAHPGVVLEQVADHQHAPGRARPPSPPARRRPPTGPAASRRSSACPPPAPAPPARRAWAPGWPATTASSSGSASRSSSVRGHARPRQRGRPLAARLVGGGRHSPAQLARRAGRRSCAPGSGPSSPARPRRPAPGRRSQSHARRRVDSPRVTPRRSTTSAAASSAPRGRRRGARCTITQVRARHRRRQRPRSAGRARASSGTWGSW